MSDNQNQDWQTLIKRIIEQQFEQGIDKKKPDDFTGRNGSFFFLDNHTLLLLMMLLNKPHANCQNDNTADHSALKELSSQMDTVMDDHQKDLEDVIQMLKDQT